MERIISPILWSGDPRGAPSMSSARGGLAVRFVAGSSPCRPGSQFSRVQIRSIEDGVHQG